MQSRGQNRVLEPKTIWRKIRLSLNIRIPVMRHFSSEFFPLFSLIRLKPLMDSEHISCFAAEKPAEPGGFTASQDKEPPFFSKALKPKTQPHIRKFYASDRASLLKTGKRPSWLCVKWTQASRDCPRKSSQDISQEMAGTPLLPPSSRSTHVHPPAPAPALYYTEQFILDLQTDMPSPTTAQKFFKDAQK